MDAMRAFKPPPTAADAWRTFLTTFESLQGDGDGEPAGSAWPSEIERILRWYVPQLQRLHEDAAVRQGDLDQLARMAAGYASRERFLTELTLDPPEATSDESGPPGLDEDYVILSTIHAAKGQEWGAVFVLNVVDGCMPSDMATGDAAQIEEERRLLYVAMTRAKQHLHLIVPQRFYVTQQRSFGDKHLYGSLSRFIPPEVALCFERTGPGVGPDAAGEHDAPPSAPFAPLSPADTFDVAARVRSIWD
jgi:DNA helicase-2/ATP-dependent DNA helicase PcrA